MSAQLSQGLEDEFLVGSGIEGQRTDSIIGFVLQPFGLTQF